MQIGAYAPPPRRPASFPTGKTAAFTLVEALISTIVLALSAAAIIGLYTAGLSVLDQQRQRTLMDEAMRSRMDTLLATPYDDLQGGSVPIQVSQDESLILTMAWTVQDMTIDRDDPDRSDGYAEAKRLTVTLDVLALSTVVTNPTAK